MNQTEKKKRPGWVWVISIFCLISAAWTLFSSYLIWSNTIPLTPEQKAYFDNLSTLDYVITILAGLAIFLGAISLFLLRKISFYLLTGALIANSLLTLWHVANKGWVVAIGGDGLIGAMIGWGLLIAVCLYVWSIKKNGILT